MRRLTPVRAAALLAFGLLAGCADNGASPVSTNGNGASHDPPAPKVTKIAPGPEAYDQAIEALIVAQPGEVIEFAAGKFEFEQPISCTKDNITIRGAGRDKTELNFAKMGAGSGSAGIYASKVKNLVIEDLAVVDSPKDGIKTEECTHTIYRNLKVEWTGKPDTGNGPYGVYPVSSTDVLVEGCYVRGASDAGVYVGQCKNVIVRNNEATENVAGIEIENTIGADVYNNTSYGNTGGILVFTLPDLPAKEGRDCRVYDNKCYENNHENFGAPGSVVATIPPGTGVMVMANKNVHVYRNEIRDNKSINCCVISYRLTERPIKDDKYDPDTGGIFIHDNTFAGGGDDPQGRWSELKEVLGLEALPDIVYDGMVNDAWLVDGKLPPEMGVYLANNADADMVNIATGARNAEAFAGSLPEPPPVKIDGVE